MLDKWALLQVFTPDMNLQLEVSVIKTLDRVLSETGFARKPSAVQPVAFHMEMGRDMGCYMNGAVEGT